jgi:hypothetical protein
MGREKRWMPLAAYSSLFPVELNSFPICQGGLYISLFGLKMGDMPPPLASWQKIGIKRIVYGENISIILW